MNISNKGIELIKSFEGCRLYAYKPFQHEKYFTIGWGHYGHDVYEGMKITQNQADELLLKDLEKYVNAVRNTRFSFTPNQNQFDALCSFCYNLGIGIMNDFAGMSAKQVSNEIPLYNKSGGITIAGLVRRRKEEKNLFDSLGLQENPSIGYEKDYSESGVFYPTEYIYFRNNPYVGYDNPVQGYYNTGECVIYDKVVWNKGYVWISWIGKNGQRRFMPIREIINGKPQAMWGYIK